MARQEYNSCMIPFMKGGGPDRKLRFCTGAKICSGKAKTEEEARQICLSEPPKPPKTRKTKGVKSITDPAKLATCMIANVNLSKITIETLEAAIVQCSTVPSKPITYKSFMKACLKKEGAVDFTKSQSAIKKCAVEWKATHEL